MNFLRYLLREAGLLHSGAMLRLRDDAGDPRSDELKGRWERATARACRRISAVRFDLVWEHRVPTLRDEV